MYTNCKNIYDKLIITKFAKTTRKRLAFHIIFYLFTERVSSVWLRTTNGKTPLTYLNVNRTLFDFKPVTTVGRLI